MTDSIPSSDSPSVAPHATSSALAMRFAHLVAHMAAEPAAPADDRSELRAFLRAMYGQVLKLSALDDGVLLANGEPCDAGDPAHGPASVFLAARLSAFGVETLTLWERTAEADLNDLLRLLATEPSQPDPVAYFAARASAIDPRSVPRQLRVRASDPSGVVAPSVATPEGEAVAEPSAVAERTIRAEPPPELLEIPEPRDPELASLFGQIREAPEIAEQRPLLLKLADYADLAYRTGRHADMLEAISGLVALELTELEREPSDARRTAFAQAMRRLANPFILRQLAVLRHRNAHDALAVRQLHAVLSRFGNDGVEALVEEYGNAPTVEARAGLLEAMRALRRTFDVLSQWVRDSDEFTAREAVVILGALGGDETLPLLAEALRRPQPRVRYAAVAALSSLGSPSALEQLEGALADATTAVRAQAVAAWRAQGFAALPRLVPMLEREEDPEVLYSAMTAIGALAAPEGVQALIACARGESGHPLRRNSVFRLQACAALVLARTPQAMTAVGLLRDDRDRTVREGALRLVAQAKRRTTGSIRVVTE